MAARSSGCGRVLALGTGSCARRGTARRGRAGCHLLAELLEQLGQALQVELLEVLEQEGLLESGKDPPCSFSARAAVDEEGPAPGHVEDVVDGGGVELVEDGHGDGAVR